MKTSEISPPKSLAILGGTPALSEALHVGRPNVANPDAFKLRVDQILERNWLTNNGPVVKEFEAKIAQHAGVKHCIAVCNATIGLELAIRASGLTGEVIIPSYTFVATAHALQWQEITPIFADISEDTHNIDPDIIERHITPRTSGILAAHLWGRACNIHALEALAKRRSLKLLFDAAHAFGSSYEGKPMGGFGNAEVFSFHATKFLNAFEGGAITTNDDELAAKIRLMKNFGFSGYDRVSYIGTNGKMTEICAAMGLSNLESYQRIIDANKRNFESYTKALSDLAGIKLIRPPATDDWNYQYVVLEIDSSQCGLTRDQLVAVLHAENVLARKYFWPGCHRMEPYASHYPYAALLLPNTEAVAERVMVLPTGLSITASDIELVASIIRLAIEQAPALQEIPVKN